VARAGSYHRLCASVSPQPFLVVPTENSGSKSLAIYPCPAVVSRAYSPSHSSRHFFHGSLLGGIKSSRSLRSTIQLTVVRRGRPGYIQLSPLDRLLWVWLYRVWPRCLNIIVLVKPASDVTSFAILLTAVQTLSASANAAGPTILRNGAARGHDQPTHTARRHFATAPTLIRCRRRY
jgi:hypothetical protein